ncbi:hypothetical protein BYT27DRAFT_6412202 [Phlegmacium glaucopus]|nr:hypothetical protein BYT27DRAFT_6412202 [Phlegmacium glaucopus]
MAFDALINTVLRRLRPDNGHSHTTPNYQANTSKLTSRLSDVFLRTYDLGFTAFGGPPVHFQILHRRFVDSVGKPAWLDEQTYQELFAITQALPGPASTKMLFNIAQIHAGMIPALFVFFVWALPGAIGMYGLSLGVQRIGEHLPNPVYALLSGVNAATVGIIALAAVQLARKAITDPLTRILLAFGGSAGLCFSALWYFPVLLVFGGLVTLIWDRFGQSWVKGWLKRRNRRRSSFPQPEDENQGPHQRQITSITAVDAASRTNDEDQILTPVVQSSQIDHSIPVKVGLALIIGFLAALTVFLSLRGALHPAPLPLSLFNNMFLAGTIIFGGGPVVIPLLRNYVVDPGWVSPRDFLLGLAVIQAMPGPNFNFAVYLGALSVVGPTASKSIPSVVGAILGFLGIFTPGLWLSIAFQSLWSRLRKRREVVSILRGVNATAVGFIFTAVYRLWEIGYLTPKNNQGASLGQEPWWLVIAATTFTAVEWFSVPPAVAILIGGAAGLAWWGAVGHRLQL